MSMYTISSQFHVVYEYRWNENYYTLCNNLDNYNVCERSIGYDDEKWRHGIVRPIKLLMNIILVLHKL
jgi:hypothetical protein